MQDMGVEFFSIKGKRIPIKGMTTLQLRELVQRYYK